MKLTLVSTSLYKVLEIAWLEIETSDGSFVIMPGHKPMIVETKAGKNITLCLLNGKIEIIKETAGIIEVQRSAVLFLINM